ncbi:MAG: helix-hairpin-helix domain-containing protein [Pseudomonadota bacterium]|nr:helix-hairpin-helix domain-containing protein [Pseudomonadota bacterium]
MLRTAIISGVVMWLLCATPGMAAPKNQFFIPLPININVSDALTLSRALVGVGPVKAEAIVQYRERHGPFVTVEDLLQVKGIGKGTLRKNSGRIALE